MYIYVRESCVDTVFVAYLLGCVFVSAENVYYNTLLGSIAMGTHRAALERVMPAIRSRVWCNHISLHRQDRYG